VGSKLGMMSGAELGNVVGTALRKELVAFVVEEQPMRRKTIVMYIFMAIGVGSN